MERIEPYILDGNALFSCRTELSPPFGPADMDPIGGLVTGTGETTAFHERFDQNGTITIACFPIMRPLAGGQTQDFRCEVVRFNPGQNQKTSIVDGSHQAF